MLAALSTATFKVPTADAFPIKGMPSGCDVDGTVYVRFVTGSHTWRPEEKNAVLAGFEMWEQLKAADGTYHVNVVESGTTPPSGWLWDVSWYTFTDENPPSARASCGEGWIRFNATSLKLTPSGVDANLDDIAAHEMGHALGLRHTGTLDSTLDPNNGNGVMTGAYPRSFVSDDFGQLTHFHDQSLGFAANANPGFEQTPAGTGSLPRFWHSQGGTFQTRTTGCYRGNRCVDYKSDTSGEGFKSWIALADVGYPFGPDELDATFRYKRINAASTGYAYGWLYTREVTYPLGSDNWPYDRLDGYHMGLTRTMGPLVQVGSYKGGFGASTSWQLGAIPVSPLYDICGPPGGPSCIPVAPRNIDAQLLIWTDLVNTVGNGDYMSVDDAQIRTY